MTDNDLGVFRVGDGVWFRGKCSSRHTVRGVVEDVEREGDTLGGVRYSVRLENGNFATATWNQVKERSR